VSAGHIVALVAAVALAAFAVWKRKRLGFEKTAIALLVALGLVVWGSGLLSHLPNPEKAIESIAKTLGPWTYALVGLMAFLETGAFVGLIAPGEFTIIIGGVVAGQGEIQIVPLIGLAWLCCILGDSASFFIGRKLGRSFMVKHGPKVRITEETLEKVEKYFARHGGKTVLIGRFIGLVRAVAPFVAGSSGMRYRVFLPYSVLGTGLWATTFSLLGFFFYRSFHKVANVAGQVTLVFGVLVAFILGSVWAYRRLRDGEQRRVVAAWLERQGQRPLLRPVAAVVRPLWRRVLRPAGSFLAPHIRFLFDRVTPGGLGIELTTPLAVAAVGSYIFVWTTVGVLGRRNKGPTALDTRVAGWAADLRSDTAVDVAKVLTNLGSSVVVGSLVLISVVLLAWRRRPYELFVLLVGTLLVFAAVHIVKAATDRPRPAGGLVDATMSSFPSGHAAYSVAYVAIGVIASRVLPGFASRAGLVIGAVLISAVVGLTRVYLGVHYYSDVVAGWALAATIYAICTIVALVVYYVRHTAGERAPGGAQPATATDHG
jgi:undecaprenyl-diphosphatase